MKKFDEFCEPKSNFKHDWLLTKVIKCEKDIYPYEPLELPQDDLDTSASEKIKEFLKYDFNDLCKSLGLGVSN